MISIIRNIAKNTFILTFAQIVSKIFGIVFITVLARHVGASGMGKFGFATSFIAISMIIANFGFGTLLTRDLARDRTKASIYLSNTLFIKIFFLLIVYCLIFVITKVLNYPIDTTIIIYFIGVSEALNSLEMISTAVFRAYEKMEYEALVNTIGSLFYVCLGITGIYLGYSLTKIVFLLIFASLFKLVLSLTMLKRKFVKLNFKVDLGFCKQFILSSIPFGALLFIDVIFYNTDKIMLSTMKGDVEVGYYFAANKLLVALFIFPSMYMTAIFPVFSKLYVSSKRLLKILYRKSFDLLILIALPIAVGVFLIGDKLIILLYGEEFENSIIVLRILIWVVIFSFVGYVNSALLLASGRQVFFTVAYGVTVVLNIILNYFLIKKLDYIGACIATLIVTALEFLFYSIVCHNFLKVSFSWKILLKILISVSLMGVFVRYFIKINISIIIIGILASVIYFTSLYLLKTFSKEDIYAIRNVIRPASPTNRI